MTIKLGFIGFGIMGQRLCAAARNHDSAVLAVSGAFDPDPKAAHALAAIDPSLKAFESVESVIANSDCVHIASPPQSHLDYLDRCADAGTAALCEKPLATDTVLARKAITTLAAKEVRAAVNFPMASSFAVDYLTDWISEGVIGTPERVDIDLAFPTWPRAWQMDAIGWLDRRAEGGFTREVASHFLFLSRRMCGPLTLGAARCDYPHADQTERSIGAELTAGDLPVSLTGNVGTTEKPDHNTWTLTGDAGRIRLRDWSIAEREIDGEWKAPADALPNEQARPKILARQLDKVAAMARGEQTNLATLTEAFEVQCIVEDILTSPARS